MKMCPRHFSDLTAAIKRKGLWRLVSQDSAEAQRRTQLWLAGKSTPRDIDPLLIATLEIYAKATQLCGHAINGGEVCPLCEVARVLQLATIADTWIDDCSDAMVVLCQVNQLPMAVH